METERTTASRQHSDSPAPKKLTFTENVLATVKILVGFGLLGAAIWGIDLLTGR
jgi:hypothetical protein